MVDVGLINTLIDREIAGKSTPNEVPFDEVRVVQAPTGEQSLEFAYGGKAMWSCPIPQLDEHHSFSVSGLKGAVGFKISPA